MRRCLLVFLLATVASAQIRITEVSVDPVGADLGNQIVELTNDLNQPVDLTGWHVSAGGATVPLPAVVLQAGQIARLHVARAGTSSPADLFVPALPVLQASDTCTVHRSANASDPMAVVDFVAWGGGQQGIATAVQAGQWPSTLASVALPAGEGATIAHFGAASFVGADHPEAWFADRTPTLGVRNDHGSIFVGPLGCPQNQTLGGPGLGLARPETRPWIGERFELDVYNVPASVGAAGLFLGRAMPAVPLDVLGMTACALHVSIDHATTVRLFSGLGTWSVVIPVQDSFVGAELRFQALVSWPGAPNPAQALISQVAIATIGSR